MARTFAPIVPPTDPAECAPWLNRELRRISIALRQGQSGLAAVARGEAPDASGNPLVDLSGVFLLAGRFGGQLGYGDRSAGGSLAFSSTNNATKGFIYLGDARTSMFDETNQRIGLNTVPLFRLHQKHAANETMQRWEGPGTAVTNCITNGTTTVTHASSGFATVQIGMVVSGTLVPVGTTVTGWTDANTITLSVAISASGSPSTMTFAHKADFGLNASSEWSWQGSAALNLVMTGGVTPTTASGIRLLAASTGAALADVPRGWLQFGPTNLNGIICGHNAATGTSLHTLFTYSAFSSWGGVNTTLAHNARVGINADPFEYRNSAAASQTGSFIVARMGTPTNGVPTMIVEGTSGSQHAISIRDASSGTGPNKTIGTNALGGFQHDGQVILGTSGLIGVQALNGGLTIMTVVEQSGNANSLGTGLIGAWSDTLAQANSRYLCLGALTAGHRAMLLASSGFGVFTRFGISSAYTLISNGQAGGASGGFPAPDNTTNPTLLWLHNSTNNGFDGTVLLKFKSQRTGQTGDYVQWLNQSDDRVLASVSKDGVFSGVTGDVFYEGDAVSYDDENVYYSTANP